LIQGASCPAGCNEALTVRTDGTYVYWDTLSAIWRVPVGGAAPTLLTQDPIAYPHGFTTASSTGYLTQFGDPDLFSLPLPGGGGVSPTVIATSPDFQPGVVLQDGSSLYFATDQGPIYQVPVQGGAITPVTPGLAQIVEALAIDSTTLYWAAGPPNPGIFSISLAGGTPVHVGTATMPRGLAVDDVAIYWSDLDTNTIMSQAK
jgi:hypothetical protein